MGRRWVGEEVGIWSGGVGRSRWEEVGMVMSEIGRRGWEEGMGRRG